MPAELRYEILHVDLDKTIHAVECPRDASGLAFVFRFEGAPVGFSMKTVASGETLAAREVARLGFSSCGTIILQGRVQSALQPVMDTAPFPTLDIAICTHGRASELTRCLERLQSLGLTQSEGIRVIVIDNARKDSSTEDAVRAVPNVVYIQEPLQGLDFARNRAVHASTAELLAFLDDDVVIDPSWLPGLKAAWALDPEAGAFTGPILPWELETRAQVTFEQMGGFGKSFERIRYTKTLAKNATFPAGAGILGAGANMAFRTEVLRDMGGFDNALDTGAPLPGGGDLDILYRLIRAGYTVIHEPKLVVYHRHRREYHKLRHQMWTWGTGTMAFLTKAWNEDLEFRPKIRQWIQWWAVNQASKIFVPFLRKKRLHWPVSMVLAEVAGGVIGLCGEYGRSQRRIAEICRLGGEQAPPPA